jgi:hypothetical protein
MRGRNGGVSRKSVVGSDFASGPTRAPKMAIRQIMTEEFASPEATTVPDVL